MCLAIRRFESGDGPAVRALHERALRAVDAYHEEFAHLDTDLSRVEAAYLGAGGEFLVGERDGKVVAMGGYWPADEETRPPAPDRPTAELKRMRVEPEHHRRGFGTALLDALEVRAREDGFEAVVLDTSVGQSGAQAFYEHHGYERVGREEFRWTTLVYYRKGLYTPVE